MIKFRAKMVQQGLFFKQKFIGDCPVLITKFCQTITLTESVRSGRDQRIDTFSNLRFDSGIL